MLFRHTIRTAYKIKPKGNTEALAEIDNIVARKANTKGINYRELIDQNRHY